MCPVVRVSLLYACLNQIELTHPLTHSPTHTLSSYLHVVVTLTCDRHVVAINTSYNVSDLHPVALSDVSVPFYLRRHCILSARHNNG